MGMCSKCSKISGFLFLALGLAFLLVDLKMWAFFNISWFTGLFLLLGIIMSAKSHCPQCHGPAKGKK